MDVQTASNNSKQSDTTDLHVRDHLWTPEKTAVSTCASCSDIFESLTIIALGLFAEPREKRLAAEGV
jgi:hypothetical protein